MSTDTNPSTAFTSRDPPALQGFYAFLDQPLFLKSRVALVLLVIPLVLAFSQPLWRITLYAPQYPGGLHVDIYAHTIDGGNDGRDIDEINTLNHYIGMHRIDRAELSDLDWIPFALGAIALLSLRAAAIGNVRALLDVVVILGYALSFSFARFYYKLWYFGHHLDPHAALKVEPFTPVVLGSKQIANFSTHAWPQSGAALAAIFTIGLVLIAVWHLAAGYRAWALARRRSHPV